MVPHFGPPDDADITCNECGIVLRTVANADLQRTYDEMELGLATVAMELCPYCGNRAKWKEADGAARIC